jgi:hypothetical protein
MRRAWPRLPGLLKYLKQPEEFQLTFVDWVNVVGVIFLPIAAWLAYVANSSP